MNLLGVEPDVALIGHLGGELVVLGVVLAHGNPHPRGGAELHGSARQALFPLGGLVLAAEVAGVGQLLADLLEVPLALGQGDILQHAVEVVQLPLAPGNLLGEHPLGGLGLVVLLIISGRVLLGRQQRVQGNLRLPALRVVEVDRPQHAHALLHGVEVGGDDVAPLPQPLPVPGGLQLPALVVQLAGGAVPGAGHRLHQVLALLLHPLGIFPVGIELVQHLAKGLHPPQLHSHAVLKDGQEGVVGGLALPENHIGRKVFLLYGVHKGVHPLQQAGASLLPQLAEADGGVPGGLEGQLPADEGGQAVKGVQQPPVHRPLLGCGGHQALQLPLLQGQRIALVLGHGRVVEQPGQQLPLAGGQVPLHPADAVGDAPLAVQENQVGRAAHQLQHQAALHPVPQLVQALQLKLHQPLHRGLDDVQNPGAGQVFAQKHTEHGGRVRVFPGNAGQLHPGVVGAGREKQFHVLPAPPHRHHNLVPDGLINLVNLAAQHGGLQLLRHGGEANRVQGHGLTPPSSAQRAG